MIERARRRVGYAAGCVLCAAAAWAPAWSFPAEGTIKASGYAPALVEGGVPYPTDAAETSYERVTLDGEWFFAPDPEDRGVRDGWYAPGRGFEGWRRQDVPGTWNAAFEDLFRYEGAGWYAREFETPSGLEGKWARLAVRGAFLESRVWFNGREAGSHSGGYTPAYYEIGGWVPGGMNRVVLRVDNRITEATVPSATTSHGGDHGWYPWGGLHRGVYVEIVPEVYIFKADIRTEPEVEGGAARVSAYLGVQNRGERDAECELSGEITAAAGRTAAVFPAYGFVAPGGGKLVFLELDAALEEARLWEAGGSGRLYTLRLWLSSCGAESRAAYTFGIREFEIRGEEIYLNGRRHFLRGMNRHEDAPVTGQTQTLERMEGDVALLKELGVNHVRPGHYPCDARFLDLLDAAGITVVEEIPAYQTPGALMSDPRVAEKAERQLIEMIERDRNHPSVIGWSLANEVHTFEPAARGFIEGLHETAKRWDPGRFTTTEIAVMPYGAPDHVSDVVDVVSLNEYFGWYYGTIDALGGFLDRYHRRFAGKPFIISEFGAGTVLGRHVEKVKREPHTDHSYSEEFQEEFYRRQFGIILGKPYVAGTMPWVFADFHMEWTPTTGSPHPAKWMNLKGLVTLEREKKKAFYAVKEIYGGLKERYEGGGT
ncbi:MAG: glycoside hydrolase family 2 TIM barrel-domain containing protein [bacterium]